MPKVSVVITARNAMAYLPETMDSILAQTFRDFEVVLVNNGSTDHIVEWATELAGSDPRIKLISQENRGIPGGLNRALAHAEGEYIAFIDGDDLWDPTKLEKQVQVLDESPDVGLVYNWVTLINETSKDMSGLISAQSLVKFDIEGNVVKQILERDIIGCGSSAMVRRICFETVGNFNETFILAADWDMWVRIALRYRFRVIKELLTYYRKHTNSMTSNWKASLQDCGVAIERIFSYVPQELQYIKQFSYGRLYLYHAWNRVKSRNERGFEDAEQLHRQAVRYYPKLAYTRQSIKIRLGIMLLKWLGEDSCDRVLRVLYGLRRRSSSVE